jgi:hypothetical protein
MNKLIKMMNLCTKCTFFPGVRIKFAMHGKRGACITNLIKTTENGVHQVHRFIIYMNKVINILNIYQLIDNNDVSMYPDVLRGAYAFFLQGPEGRVLE